MVKKKSFKEKLEKIFNWNRESIGLFFLGVGLTMFIVNITAILNILPYLSLLSTYVEYPLLGYYVSVLSSIILMTYSLYNMYVEA